MPERRATPDAPSGGKRTGDPLLVDGHVHIHARFRLVDVFSAAARNFARRASGLGLPAPRTGVLALVESRTEGSWERLRSATSMDLGGWELTEIETDLSMLAASRDPTGCRLIIVRGRQTVTREGLEVLAIGTGHPLDDGLSLVESIAAARETGAAAAVPWGFGKWWGRRGRLLRRTLEASAPGEFLLADSGGRPRGGRRPGLLETATERGIPVLAGSDPLPFAGEERLAGSSGFVIEAGLDGFRPAADVARRLRALPGSPRLFLRKRDVVEFVRVQARMQWRKHAAGSGRERDLR